MAAGDTGHAAIIRSTSAWDEHQIDRFLAETVIPIRLACIDREASHSSVRSGICMQKARSGVRHSKPRVWLRFCRRTALRFRVAPESMPYRGVRGQGKVSLSAAQGPDILLRLIDRYLGNRDSALAAG